MITVTVPGAQGHGNTLFRITACWYLGSMASSLSQLISGLDFAQRQTNAAVQYQRTDVILVSSVI